MAERLVSLKKKGGGELLHIEKFAASNTTTNMTGYARLDLDTSKVNTLSIESITTMNGPVLGYIRARDVNNVTIKELQVSNNVQTVDVSNYNSVQLAIYFTRSSGEYATISMNNISGH